MMLGFAAAFFVVAGVCVALFVSLDSRPKGDEE